MCIYNSVSHMYKYIYIHTYIYIIYIIHKYKTCYFFKFYSIIGHCRILNMLQFYILKNKFK